MRNSSGGSSHDPSARLPPPMWDRRPPLTDWVCAACKGRQNPDHRKTFKHLVSAKGGYLACPRCDRSR